MGIVMMIGMLALVLGANFYLFYRLWQMMPPTVVGHALQLAAGIFLAVSPFLAIMLSRWLPEGLGIFLYRVGSSWLIILLFAVMLLLLIDIAGLFLPVKHYLSKSWAAFGCFAAAVALVMLLGNARYHNKDRVELNIALDKHLDRPLRIVAVSDMHLGYTIGPEELRRWVGMINAQNPDLILIAGDLVDNDSGYLARTGMNDILRTLQARYGVYAVLGNHEYIAGEASARPDRGIEYLRDEARPVADSAVWLVGRDDRSNPSRKTLTELAATTDRDRPLIMLDHQPFALAEAPAAGIDIQISGHTHHGQVWLLSLVTRAMYEVSHGYKLVDGTHVYVSSGLGIWGGKFRIGTRSEYLVINLTGRN